MRVLVTGGAGYVGSHAVASLRDQGHDVAVVDDLSRGHRSVVPESVGFLQSDLRDLDRVRHLIAEFRPDCIMHFAAFAYVGESMEHPIRYYANNVVGSLHLLAAALDEGVRRFVFSSSCATYGIPQSLPILESSPQEPVSPYGRTKLVIERALADVAAARPDFRYAILRYFNVAGAREDGSLGESHDPETHLVPRAVLASLSRLDGLEIHGDDYPTPDGTAIRDYVHVQDLVDAHILVMKHLDSRSPLTYNVGTGRGRSVKEVVDHVQELTGRPFPVSYGARRPGDPPELFADVTKIRTELGWTAQRDLSEMITSTHAWLSREE